MSALIEKKLSDNPANRIAVINALIAELAHLNPDKNYYLEVAEETRSLQQNKYLWGVCYKYIVRFMDDNHQRKYSAEAVHETLKEMFLEHRVEQMKDREVKIYLTTTKLTKKQFSDYVEQIKAWAAEFGCVIPDPQWDYFVVSNEKAA